LPVYEERPAPVNQGDIFEDVPFLEPGAAGAFTWGMVISHDCEVDKFRVPARPLTPEASEAWRFTMAVVHPIEDLNDDRARAVRANRMPRYLYLAAEGDLPELCVDLWTEQPVSAAAVMDCSRIACLSPESRVGLWWKIIRLRLGMEYKSILRGEVPPDAA
jgi:hypothetical protein